MTRPTQLLIPVLLLALAACERGTTHAASSPAVDAACTDGCGGDHVAQPEAEQLEAARNDPKGAYGMGLTLTEATKISDILRDPEAFRDQRLLVRGEAIAVCQTRGCWIELKGDEPFQSLRVKVEDGEIVFPMSCMGHEVSAEGVLQKIEIPVERHREILKSRAEKNGEAFDPASVTAPMVVWQLRGLGARIDA